MINKSLQSIVTANSINLSTILLVQMRAIYVHFHAWERDNEWSYTFIYANWEIYEFAWRREEENSYTPWSSMYEIHEVNELMSWHASYNPPTARDSVRALSSDKVGGSVYEWEVVSTMSQRSYQKVTRTNLLHITCCVIYDPCHC